MATQQASKLADALWRSADELRGQMDASEYKNYLLGLVFYKYLSDHLIYRSAYLVGQEPQSLEEAQAMYVDAFNDEELQEDLIAELQESYGYYLEPSETYNAIVDKINNHTFQLTQLEEAFRDIEQSDDIYKNLFSDVDLHSTRSGPNPPKTE